MTHSIHLRAPWRRTNVGIATTLTRRFNTPTGLDAHEQVWLCIDQPTHPCEVRLNDQLLGRATAQDCSAFQVDARLTPYGQNCVELNFNAAEAETPDFGGVWLEIRVQSTKTA